MNPILFLVTYRKGNHLLHSISVQEVKHEKILRDSPCQKTIQSYEINGRYIDFSLLMLNQPCKLMTPE